MKQIEISNIGLFHWLHYLNETNKTEYNIRMDIDDFYRLSLSFGRLLGEAFGEKDSPLILIKQRKRVLLKHSSPEQTKKIKLQIDRLFRRIGFSHPSIPSLDMKSPKAWKISNPGDSSNLGKFLFHALYNNIPEEIFSSIVWGLQSYGERIHGGLAYIAEDFPMEEAWHAWKNNTGDSVDDPEELFNLYLDRFLSLEKHKDKAKLAETLDPDLEWMPLFQAGLLMKYEQVLRKRALDWIKKQTNAIPKISPERKERLFEALSLQTT